MDRWKQTKDGVSGLVFIGLAGGVIFWPPLLLLVPLAFVIGTVEYFRNVRQQRMEDAIREEQYRQLPKKPGAWSWQKK